MTACRVVANVWAQARHFFLFNSRLVLHHALAYFPSAFLISNLNFLFCLTLEAKLSLIRGQSVIFYPTYVHIFVEVVV